MKKRVLAASVLLIILVLTVCSFTYNDVQPYQKQTLKKIVIDAGHGGSDEGARGKYSKEKDVALAISLQLQKEIQEQLPEVEVYMTRTTDVFDRVTVKADKANEAKGDLFIAIHCDWAPGTKHSEIVGYKTVKYKRKKKTYTKQVPEYRTYYSPSDVKGTSTFIWNINKTDNKVDAIKNHEDMFMDSLSLKELHDFDPNDPAKQILYSLKTKQFFDRSARLALAVEDEFKKTGRPSRQAQQRGKGIWVLQAVAMPSILVETGFISNPEEEDYLNSKEGQKEIAEVITKAVKRYKQGLEGGANSAKPETTEKKK